MINNFDQLKSVLISVDVTVTFYIVKNVIQHTSNIHFHLSKYILFI